MVQSAATGAQARPESGAEDAQVVENQQQQEEVTDVVLPDTKERALQDEGFVASVTELLSDGVEKFTDGMQYLTTTPEERILGQLEIVSPEYGSLKRPIHSGHARSMPQDYIAVTPSEDEQTLYIPILATGSQMGFLAKINPTVTYDAEKEQYTATIERRGIDEVKLHFSASDEKLVGIELLHAADMAFLPENLALEDLKSLTVSEKAILLKHAIFSSARKSPDVLQAIREFKEEYSLTQKEFIEIVGVFNHAGLGLERGVLTDYVEARGYTPQMTAQPFLEEREHSFSSAVYRKLSGVPFFSEPPYFTDKEEYDEQELKAYEERKEETKRVGPREIPLKEKTDIATELFGEQAVAEATELHQLLEVGKDGSLDKERVIELLGANEGPKEFHRREAMRAAYQLMYIEHHLDHGPDWLIHAQEEGIAGDLERTLKEYGRLYSREYEEISNMDLLDRRNYTLPRE